VGVGVAMLVLVLSAVTGSATWAGSAGRMATCAWPSSATVMSGDTSRSAGTAAGCVVGMFGVGVVVVVTAARTCLLVSLGDALEAAVLLLSVRWLHLGLPANDSNKRVRTEWFACGIV
jgi:hypothetical protein